MQKRMQIKYFDIKFDKKKYSQKEKKEQKN